MRTTLDVDDALLAEAQRLFPAGTPKTVIFEEGLRRLIARPAPLAPELTARHERDPRMAALIAQGRVEPATASGSPPVAPGVLPTAQILLDLAGDREDR